ncbi:MAG: cytoplasmic protein [Candidatus Omnitrophota bacterium]|nr:cytoplasmic protein [Candidatus Omnitrophota bacterium]
MMRQGITWALCGIIVGLGVAGAAWAQDPVEVGPDIYTVKFENERVRVSEIKFVPGASIAMHSHPDHFLYVLAAGTLQLGHPDGTTAEFVGTPGQVAWIPAESHAAVNTGTTEFRGLVVELKE